MKTVTETRLTVLICSLLALTSAISIAMAAPAQGHGLFGAACGGSSVSTTGCP
jgi:hypothetical protein